MGDLKRQLTRELQQDLNVKLLKTLTWSLPVHSIEIAYQTVKRTKMDILMKMMLIAFQKGAIETAEELSELLLVDALFINDLISLMTRTKIIEKKGSTFGLTEKGVQQLATGIFVHEPESATTKALFSACHQNFLQGELKSDPSEALEVYRWKDEFNDWEIDSLEDSLLRNALRSMNVESDESNAQIVVSDIISAIAEQTVHIPCLEFQLYNKSEDLFYVRVWNTLLQRWDETLETQLNDKERKQWREEYLEKYDKEMKGTGSEKIT
jgi:hypothetical protein